MIIYEIGTGYTPIPAQIPAATESIVEELTKEFLCMKLDTKIIDICANKRAPHDLPITEVKLPLIFTRSDISLGIMHKLKRVFYSIALAKTLKKILCSNKEKVLLHFHNQYNLFFYLLFVPKKYRKNAVIAYTNHNGLWSLEWDSVKSRLKKRYFQEIYSMKHSDIVFALNPKMRKNIIENIGVAAEKTVLIGNGVNPNIYAPLSESEKENLKKHYGLEGKNIILQVGSIYENKGQARSVELLAPLLKQNDNLIFAYAGAVVSQEYHDEFKKLVSSLGLSDKVVYLGSVIPGENMNKIYNLADATVFVSEYESFGLVCIESMAAGIPVVTCSDSTMDFKNGCVVSSPDSFTEDVDMCISSDQSRIEKLRTEARENAQENFSWKKIAADYYNAFLKHTNK